VEFIHTATLLHDDVVDESHQRRGQASANDVWGNQPSVLVGDFLFSRAFQLMVEAESLPILKILADAAAAIAEGEVWQLATANDLGTNFDDYLKVVNAKTAALFAAACQCGAMSAQATTEQAQALGDYGSYLGVAFQLIDDVLDYAASTKQLGKSQGDDFREGKVTLPVILAYEKASAEERAFWQRCIEKQEQNEEDFNQAVALLTKHQSLTQCRAMAEDYINRAKAALAPLPQSEYKTALLSVADFCLERGS
jgi:octaprenyl-diphosphate synthase